MRTKEFLSKVEHHRIVSAIKEAELRSSGEIVVRIQRGKVKRDALEVAAQKFHELGMDKTRERNAVLIFIAPRARKFALVGDEAVHQKCGDEYWQQLVRKMELLFRGAHFTAALVEGINEVGNLLGKHFPRRGDDRNELPDNVLDGGG